MSLVAREEPQVHGEAEDPNDQEVERVQVHLALVLVREHDDLAMLRRGRDVDAEEQRRARLRERDLGLREGLFIWGRRRNTGCSEVPVGWIRRRQLLLRIQRGERLLDKG